jgi:MFS family permease
MLEGARSAWVSRPFRWTFGALIVSMLGSQISLLAVPLLAALTLHASPTQMGLLAAAGQLPTFVVSLAAGVYVDRARSKRLVMITMDLARALVLLCVPAAALAGILSIPLLCSVVFLVGTATVVHELAQNAFVPSVVPTSMLLDANAKLQISYSVGESAGPGLGGLLVQAVTAPVAVVADAVSYLTSAALIARTRPRPVPSPAPDGTRAMREITEGLRALLSDELLGPWVRWGAASVVVMGAFEAQYILFVGRDLAVSPGWIGLIAASAGLGAVPAAAMITRIERRLPAGKTIILGLAAYFAFLLAVPATHSTAHATVPIVIGTLAAAKILQTVAFTVSNVQQWSLRQLTTPPHLLGRVSAGNRFLIGTAETLGALLSGPAVGLLGMRAFLSVCGVLGVLVLLPLVRTPLWTLRHLPTGTEGSRYVGER